MNNYQESIAIAQRPRDYASLLWIFGASILGFGMFCATSAVALSDPNLPTPIVIEAGDIADFAFSNANTISALTAQAFAELIPTSTATLTATLTATNTPTETITSAPTASRTPFIPTATRTSNPPVFIPHTFTFTPAAEPTNTAPPIQAYTASPVQVEPTDTPDPTETPEPPPDTPSTP